MKKMFKKMKDWICANDAPLGDAMGTGIFVSAFRVFVVIVVIIFCIAFAMHYF